ncbi:hypothetical protein BDV32DRAFT_128671 [Aspergillus pseudonomiae]|nr:hypothetical protein BDV32DRAFT_128671 [Aspergillus pseudonomiae]
MTRGSQDLIFERYPYIMNRVLRSQTAMSLARRNPLLLNGELVSGLSLHKGYRLSDRTVHRQGRLIMQ